MRRHFSWSWRLCYVCIALLAFAVGLGRCHAVAGTGAAGYGDEYPFHGGIAAAGVAAALGPERSGTHGSRMARQLSQHSASNPAKFCIVMYVFEWKQVMGRMENISIMEKKLYADYHGYELRVMRKAKQDSLVSTYFSKIASVIENMDGSCEWIWCIDLDTIIMNQTTSLETILERAKMLGSHTVPHAVKHAQRAPEYRSRGLPVPTLHHTIAPKGNYDMEGVDLVVADRCGIINSGSFLVRVTDWSKKLMSDVVGLERAVSSGEVKSVCTGRCYEQTAMSHLMLLAANHTEYRSKIAYVPARLINGMPSDGNRCGVKEYEWQPGDFMIHFAGGNSKKLFDKYWESSERIRSPLEPSQ